MWPIYVSIAGLVLSGGLAIVFGFSRSKLAADLGRARAEIETLKARILEQVELMDLLTEPDPPLDELARMSENAAVRIASGGSGLSQVESRAIDRLLRARPAREAGEDDGR